MDLWIRTHDDHLIGLKDNDIYIDTRYVNKPRIETEIGHEYRKEKVYVIENNFHYLGTYKTKERALEVLDEIQKLLDTNREEQYVTYGTGGICAKPTLICIMPKE